ncbi:MAG: hypothetical protein ACJAV2_000495 [Myxococcota bacterium]|jgi:hypothetical protein
MNSAPISRFASRLTTWVEQDGWGEEREGIGRNTSGSCWSRRFRPYSH